MTPLMITGFGIGIWIVGFIIGLGAVTVIDLHGFLGRTSSYWTIATTRTHKVTKPLIWLGTIFAIIGGCIVYRTETLHGIPLIHLLLAIILILNGCFLSFSVSPFMIEREKNGRDGELLPQRWQQKITLSFIVSFLGWWGSVFFFVIYIVQHLQN